MRRHLLVALGLATLAGCAQPARDVQAYRRVLDEGTRTPGVPVDGVLGLRDALALANRLNETLDLQGERYARALIARRRAVAAFLPTLSFEPRWRVDSSENDSGYDSDLDAPFAMDWTLFDGGQNVNRYWREVHLVEAERDRLLETQESLLLDVAEVYYLTLRGEAEVAVLTNSLVVQEARLADTQARADAGLARPLDVAQGRAQVAQTRLRLIEARRQVGESRSVLSFLINSDATSLTLQDDLVLPNDLARPADPSAGDDALKQALIDRAATHRSELRAARSAVEAARRAVREAIGQYYPSLTLSLDAFVYRESVPDSQTWAGLLQASLPVFSAGRIEADVREAWSFLREASLVWSQSSRRVTREIDLSIRDLRASEERVAQLRVALDAARDAFEQSQGSYDAGLGTNLERVAAQDALLQAELASATEGFDQQFLRLQLLRRVGVLRESLLDSTRP
jgi:outer membrane protein